MPRIPTGELARYLLEGRLSRAGCLVPAFPRLLLARLPPRRLLQTPTSTSSAPSTPSVDNPPRVSPRKQLKDRAKEYRRHGGGGSKKPRADAQVLPGWDLFVGLEIHAQLNTASKLFSPAAPPSLLSSSPSFPNSPAHAAPFDLAVPGSQPVFQPSVLVPALRAALALGCTVQPESRFDRKHYFWWDQPSGYQITQYYAPFATGGVVRLGDDDGENDGVREVRIRQVQLEQDTAKTVAQPGGLSFVDFNRAGVPLIEIITDPFRCTPRGAAAVVRAIQALLRSVDACVSGMEAGGLRADVNVSVRRATTSDDDGNMGTRTEIKNLGTIKAIEDAVIAERDRHVSVLEAGGAIVLETRGWTLGGRETYRLRGKEGDVDYRYMPDPDIPPLRIGRDLVAHLAATMPPAPDREVAHLVEGYHLAARDGAALLALDGGRRVEYFYKVVSGMQPCPDADDNDDEGPARWNKLVANWVLHELGRLTAERAPKPLSLFEDTSAAPDEPDTLLFTPDGECPRIPAQFLSELLAHLHRRRITALIAKTLLVQVFRGETPPDDITTTIEQRGLWFTGLTEGEYDELAERAMAGQENVVPGLVETGGEGRGRGKLGFVLGRMLRLGPGGRVDPSEAERAIKRRIALLRGQTWHSRVQ